MSSSVAPASGLERAAAAISHGALLLGVPFIVPIAVWLLYPLLKGPSEYVRRQALQALVFHLFVSVVAGGLIVLAMATGLFAVVRAVLNEGPIPADWFVPFLLLLVMALFTLWASIVELVATVKALQGKPYELPIVKNWV